MPTEIQRFNDVVKEDGEIRNGTGGRLAARYNLPVNFNLSFKTGSSSNVSIQIAIPGDLIPPVLDELRAIFSDDDRLAADLTAAKQITFEVNTSGDVIPGSLKVEMPAAAAQRTAPVTGYAPCENCRSNQGPHFSFTYGKKTGQNTTTSESGVVSNTSTITSYDIAGQMSVPICDRCRETFYGEQLRGGALAAITTSLPLAIFILLLITVGSEPEGLTAVVMFLTIPLFSGPIALVGLARFFNVIEDGKQRAGENLAIVLKTEDLKMQGYDTTWNSRRYDQLKRFGK